MSKSQSQDAMLLKITSNICALSLLLAVSSVAAFERKNVGNVVEGLNPTSLALEAQTPPTFVVPSDLTRERARNSLALSVPGLVLPLWRLNVTAKPSVKIYRIRPESNRAKRSALYLHSGGFVFGNSHDSAATLLALAEASSSCMYVFDYPLAPEQPFPAALHAALAVWREVSEASADAQCPQPQTVIGDSAGGNLAVALALLIRARQAQPHAARMPRLQILLYPMLDARGSSNSWQLFANSTALPAAQARWLWKTYASGADVKNELLSPSSAIQLQGLPRSIVLVAERDILRDEGIDFVQRLDAIGARPLLLYARGLPHGFLSAEALFADANKSVRNELNRAWRAFEQDQ